MLHKQETHPPRLSADALLAELIRIPSTYEHEHAILAFVEAYLSRLGVPVTRVPYDAARLRTLPSALPPFSTVEGRHCLVARYKGHGDTNDAKNFHCR